MPDVKLSGHRKLFCCRLLQWLGLFLVNSWLTFSNILDPCPDLQQNKSDLTTIINTLLYQVLSQLHNFMFSLSARYDKQVFSTIALDHPKNCDWTSWKEPAAMCVRKWPKKCLWSSSYSQFITVFKRSHRPIDSDKPSYHTDTCSEVYT